MEKSVKIMYWLPRIICILAILFISMFALDAFEPGLTIWQQVSAFLMHLIPSFILAAMLIVAWKWEYIGGVIFMILGLVTTPFIFILNYQRNHLPVIASIFICLVITFPFVVVGILFMVSHFKNKKSNLQTH